MEIRKKTLQETDLSVHERYMREAIRQARKAEALEEVPIGCVIVKDGRIIARGYNRRNTDQNTLSHAELNAIRKASKKLGDWRLEGCTLYCTLEPCQMCAGAIIQSRIDRVVIGTTSPKSGCGGTLLNILQNPDFNHQAEVLYGVMREECTEILQRFFKDLRRRNKERRKMLRMQAAGASSDSLCSVVKVNSTL
jgi:tRNA(adenine34) deaminase